MNRRQFLKGCAGFVALAATRGFGITNLVFADQHPRGRRAAGPHTPPPNGRDLLVFVFVRGGYDGLNMVIPFNTSQADRARYYTDLRPTLNVPAPNATVARKAVALNEIGGGTRFGLHPDAARGAPGVNVPNPHASDTGGLFKLFTDGELAIVDACGSPDITGSHFDTQLYVDTAGTNYSSGWLTRHLRTRQSAGEIDDQALVVAPQAAVPPSLAQWYNALAIEDPAGFGGLWARWTAYNDGVVAAQRAVLSSMIARGSDYVEQQGLTAFAAFDTLNGVLSAPYSPAAAYATDGDLAADGGSFGASLQTIARLAKANLPSNPLRVACVDVGGGWDTHDNQGTVDWGGNSRFPSLVAMLSNNIKAFHDDLQADPALRGRFTIVVVSEFGRVLYQNNSGGTDHGAGNVLWLIGGKNAQGVSNVNGGRVYGNWPGLRNLGYNDGLPVTTDYRTILADVLYTRMGASVADINDVIFPGLGFNGGLGYSHASVTGVLHA